jgi:acetyl esterase/lipase
VGSERPTGKIKTMEPIPLYPGAAPGSEDWTYAEVEEQPTPSRGHGSVRNVSKPVLLPYLPTPGAATGTAVVVCPGGAFHRLAIYHEGYDVARWLQARGVAAFVLKYRVIRTPDSSEESARQEGELRAKSIEEIVRHIDEVTGEVRPLAAADGRQAVRAIRERASEWGIGSDRIGLMGFSAGGYVAASVALRHDSGSRPDFAAVIYGARVEEIEVPDDAPPLFMALTSSDDIAVEPSLDLYRAWRRSGHPVEMHIYGDGDHGFGAINHGLPVDSWMDRFWEWLQYLQAERAR